MNEITKSLEVKTLLQPYDWGNKHPAISAMTLGTSGAISCWLIASIKWDGKGEKKTFSGAKICRNFVFSCFFHGDWKPCAGTQMITNGYIVYAECCKYLYIYTHTSVALPYWNKWFKFTLWYFMSTKKWDACPKSCFLYSTEVSTTSNLRTLQAVYFVDWQCHTLTHLTMHV